MEVVAFRKRVRSDDSPHKLQQKIHVNDKIVDSHDSNKMKQIYDKTLKLLFSAARNLPPTPLHSLALHEQIVLNGNGSLLDRLNSKEAAKRELKKVACCDREAFMQGFCKNCQAALCEYCGYSCAECFEFLCNHCVSLFGCGNTEKPLCSNCTFFAQE